jgi:hypothetical protein
MKDMRIQEIHIDMEEEEENREGTLKPSIQSSILDL